MVHCGIRGYGWQTANHFFFEGAELRGLAEEPSRGFVASRRRAARPRILGASQHAPRTTRSRTDTSSSTAISEALEEVFASDAEVYYEISHNLVQEETLVCRTARPSAASCIAKVRRARFPRGTPISPAPPGRRRAIRASFRARCTTAPRSLFARAGASSSGCSVNHGSGRLLARGEAKRDLEPLQGRDRREMREVVRTLRRRRDPRHRRQHGAHAARRVRARLQGSRRGARRARERGDRRVAHRLYPVANIKGTD